MTESLPVFPALPPPHVPFLPWHLQAGFPLCRSFPNIICIVSVCFPPAYLVASCACSWAQLSPLFPCVQNTSPHKTGCWPPQPWASTHYCGLRCLFMYLPPPWDWVFQGHCLTHLVLIVAQFGATYRVGAQMFVCRASCSLYLRQSPEELDEASQGWGGCEADVDENG